MNNRTHNYIHSTEMDTLTENYNAILDLPCVRSILKKNKKLRKENKSLRNLIQSLPEFRNKNCCCNQPNQTNKNKLVEYVDIKIENDALSLDSTTICDSDIEIIETPSSLPNIIYDIEEEIDNDSFECDDCNVKGRDCYQEIGFTKEEANVYMDLGQPDRCGDCFEKWKTTSDANEYLKYIKEEQQTYTDDEAKNINLCINIDCERYPPDWDFEEDTEDTYQGGGQWQKCCLCD